MEVIDESARGGCPLHVALPLVQTGHSKNKMLSLDFIGMTDGVYYFKGRGVAVGPCYEGDVSDYLEWRAAQRIAPVIDADAIRRIPLNARHKEPCRPVIIAEETVCSPHPWFDAIIERMNFENEAARRRRA